MPSLRCGSVVVALNFDIMSGWNRLVGSERSRMTPSAEPSPMVKFAVSRNMPKTSA